VRLGNRYDLLEEIAGASRYSVHGGYKKTVKLCSPIKLWWLSRVAFAAHVADHMISLSDEGKDASYHKT
jgi:hypothetical protein